MDMAIKALSTVFFKAASENKMVKASNLDGLVVKQRPITASVAVGFVGNHGTVQTDFPGVYSGNERGLAPQLPIRCIKHTFKTLSKEHELH